MINLYKMRGIKIDFTKPSKNILYFCFFKIITDFVNKNIIKRKMLIKTCKICL